jgi:branched-chain amino acid transport system substrate-binding protein
MVVGAAWALLAFMRATSAPAAEPIRIGAIFSVTGPASFLGEPERNTVKMLEEDLNKAGGLLGRKVEVIIYDDEYDATKAVTAVDRLLKRDRVVAIVGPSGTGSTLAVIPKVEGAKIPLISCAAGRRIVEPVRRWVFKVAASDILAVTRIFSDLKRRGLTRVALLTASDAYGAGGRDDFKELAPQAGITLAADEVFGPKDTDMTAQLTRIKGTAAQAIVVWGTNPGPAGRLIVEGQLPATHPQKSLLSKYIQEYERRFDQAVSTFGGHAWDSVMLLSRAIRDANSTQPTAIRDALEKVRGFYGTAGEFNFSPQDHSGLTEEAFAMVRVTKGDWEMLR